MPKKSGLCSRGSRASAVHGSRPCAGCRISGLPIYRTLHSAGRGLDGNIEFILSMWDRRLHPYHDRQWQHAGRRGPGSAEDILADYLGRLGLTSFEYAVFTHPHEDHIGGADMILTDFTVSNVILPDCTYNSATYTRMMDAIDESGAGVIVAESGSEFKLGDMKATVLAPNSPDYKNTHNYSIVLKIEFGETSFLLTGDAEAVSEVEMLEKYGAERLKCDLLKVGHHGSDTSTSPDFLVAVSPEYAVISCGRGNSYGHPHAVTLQKLMNEGVTVYRTDEPGDASIIFVSDGGSVTPKNG